MDASPGLAEFSQSPPIVAGLTGRKAVLLLTLLCCVMFAPGLASLPPTDRDESRFMQATKQMIETGDFLHIRFQREPRDRKPIGVYWLQAAAVEATGAGDLASAWRYRLPSALAAWLTVLMVFRLGRRLFDPPTGVAAAAMLATTLVVVAEAHLAKTDAALLCAVTVCLAALAESYVADKPHPGTVLQFWLALGAGILIKGPVIVMVAGATALTLVIADRNARWLMRIRPMAAGIIVASGAGAWLALRGGGLSLVDAFRSDVWPKLIGAQEGHGAPPGTHTLLALVTAWPWSMLVPFALILAWRRRADPAVRFCLAWLIPSWFLFELVPTKLPHYTLPLMPPLMLLIAVLSREPQRARALIVSAWGFVYRIGWAWVTVAMAVAVVIANRKYGDGSQLSAALAALAALAAAAAALAWFNSGKAIAGMATFAAAGIVYATAIFAGVLPHLNQLALSQRIAARAEPLLGNGAIALADYHEPSAVFLLGTGTILTDSAGAAAHLIAQPSALAVVPSDRLESVRDAVAAAGEALVQIDEIDGYDYSRGRWQRLALITAHRSP